MSSTFLSVAQAAQSLGVSVQRVHERIREGSLPAQRVGHQWVITQSDLRRIGSSRSPGRPFSSKSAWNTIALAARHDDAVKAMSAPDRSRARKRLGEALVRVSAAAESEEREHAAALLRHFLGNRASRRTYHASPRDLADLRADPRLHLSGISLPESGISAGDFVEAYVDETVVDDVIEHHLLSPPASGGANVVLHVVPGNLLSPAARHPAPVLSSPLVLAADLAEHDGVRERDRALRLVVDLARSFDRPGEGGAGE